MRKVAIATDLLGNLDHFGHCEKFVVFEIEDQKILRESLLTPPEHQPGLLPKFLYDRGIMTLIAANMGGMAVKIFEGLQMEVFYGLSDNYQDIIKTYLEGTLVSSTTSCREHEAHHAPGANHNHEHDHHHKQHNEK